MGSASSNNQKSKKSVLDCLKVLIEDVEFYADEEVIARMKEIYIDFPNKIEPSREKLVNIFRETIPPRVNQYEDVLLSSVRSFFQYSLLNREESKPKAEEINLEFVRDFRLTNFEKLESKKFQVGYESQLLQLCKAIKCYCTLSNQILKGLKNQKDMFCQVYVLIWEHFQNHFPKIGRDKDFDLSALNAAFDKQYYPLYPKLKGESIGGKIWGTTVEQMDIEYILQQFKQSRSNQQSSLPFAQIFNALLDININQHQLEWIGRSDFGFSEELMKVINNLKKDNEEVLNKLYVQSQGHLSQFLQLWELDNAYLKNVIPDWIVENHLDIQFIQFMESKIIENVKLLPMKDKKELWDQIQKPEVQFDFMKQLNSLNGDFRNINFCYGSQQRSHYGSTLKMIMKQVEINASSIIRSSDVTEQVESGLINQNKFSDILEEGNQQFVSEIVGMDANEINYPIGQKSQIQYEVKEEMEILVACRKFDQIRHNIQSLIEARDNKIYQRNQFNPQCPECLNKVFDFKNQINNQEIEEIVKFCGEEKKRQSNIIIFNNQFQEFDSQERSKNIAAQLLQMSD